MRNEEIQNLFKFDGKISAAKAIPFGLQHILAMFVPNFVPILIIGGACKLSPQETAMLIQCAMLIASIGTLIQLFPVWRIGARLPIVMGISFTFVSAACFIGATWGYGAVLGACLIGGLIEGFLGLFARYWLRLVTPTIAAVVVITIGFSLLPVGAASFGGGFGSPTFGNLNNLFVASVTLASCLIFTCILKSYYKQLAILGGLVVGYGVACCMGMVNFDNVAKAELFALPHLLPFKMEFNLNAIVMMTLIFMVSATETVGDTSAVVETGLKRDVQTKELSGSIACDGFVSSLSSLFGCMPITSFSQNVGLVALTKVVNRYAIAAGAIIMVLAGCFPVIGAVLATLPDAVLGGCTIMMFGSIVIAGMEMQVKAGMDHRNTVIAALSLSIGVGFTSMPKIFAQCPQLIQTVFAENCVASVFIVAVILNLVLPRKNF